MAPVREPLFKTQGVFSLLVAHLIFRLHERGYVTTLGEAYRPPEMAEIYAKRKVGIFHSLHQDRLAIDLNLFKDGKLLKTTDEYAEAGQIWKELSLPGYECAWGGEFNDGNHFSISYGGRR